MSKRTIPLLLVVAAICATAFTVHSQNSQNAAGSQHNCQPGSTDSCGSGSSIALALSSTNPVTVCPGGTVSVCVTSSNVLGTIITVTTNTDCSTTTTTNTAGAAQEGSTWWSATGLVTANGSGLCASFGVPITNQGSGTITFYVSYCNSGVCTNCGTNSISVSYTVVTCKVDLARTGGSDVINRCLYPTRNAFFCLTTNSCIGDVTWIITPTLPDGATVAGFIDNCVSIEIGNIETNYTITATSVGDTTCFGSASLTVTKDCVCSHHNLPDIPNLVYAPDGGRNCETEDWVGGVFTSPCGDTAQVTCESCTNAGRCVTFLVNGQDVGHCHYLPSTWTAQYALCVCGSVIRMTYWDVYETAPAGVKLLL